MQPNTSMEMVKESTDINNVLHTLLRDIAEAIARQAGARAGHGRRKGALQPPSVCFLDRTSLLAKRSIEIQVAEQ